VGRKAPVVIADVDAVLTSVPAALTLKSPPITPQKVQATFDALGILRGDAPHPQTPAQILASLLTLRNLTSHRFPVASPASRRASWLAELQLRRPAVERSLVRAALVLWAVRREVT
jgi:hypothetical protein